MAPCANSSSFYGIAMTEGGYFIPQEKMLSSTSPVSDAAVIRMTENTMGESALVLIQLHDSSSIWVFR